MQASATSILKTKIMVLFLTLEKPFCIAHVKENVNYNEEIKVVRVNKQKLFYDLILARG